MHAFDDVLDDVNQNCVLAEISQAIAEMFTCVESTIAEIEIEHTIAI